MGTLQSQRGRQQELRDRSSQQGAGLSSVTEEQEEEDPDWPAGEEGEQEEELACLREELYQVGIH